MNPETRPLIFSLLTIVLWGLWGFFGKLALEKRMAPITVFMAETVISALIAVVLFLVLMQKHDPAQSAVYSTINVYGIASGAALAFGFLFYYLALQGGQVTVIVPLTATYPVVAVLLGYVLLRERPTPLQWVGVMFV